MLPASWLTRIRKLGGGAPATEPATPRPVVRSAPGLAALFESLGDGRTHAVLDLGAAGERSMAVYGRLARQVRFADLGAASSAAPQWEAALEEAARAAVEPYDVLLLWDTLGRVSADERQLMVARLVALAAPGARVHLVVEAPERSGPRPHRFSLVDTGRMRHELTWDDRTAPARLLPSEIDKLLAPFQVERGFTLKEGLREYVAARRTSVRPAPEGAATVRQVRGREQRPGATARSGISSRPRGASVQLLAGEPKLERALRNGAVETPPPPEKI